MKIKDIRVTRREGSKHTDAQELREGRRDPGVERRHWDERRRKSRKCPMMMDSPFLVSERFFTFAQIAESAIRRMKFGEEDFSILL